ncbi:histidine phosphatase family protein [Glycomyces buryatensis]|uniref:histidine phosphatase family protein n=1 Tax=Glycomyces buryatensis TaxID=2570927 RepID=UPI0014562CB9|nr:histidine phosphatase family protein [Glycomyces buryatensis]
MSFSKLTLIRHALTAATRRHAFPRDEPLDEAGEAQAAALRGKLEADHAVTAPARRCRRTAELAGFAAAPDPRWSELDFGDWSGATLKEIGERDPDGLTTWLADPESAPPGGESLGDLNKRVREAMAELDVPGGDTVVFTSGGPIKAALVAALDAPETAFWRLDVAPCSVTVLYGRDGTWTVRRVNADPEGSLR